MVDEIAAEQAVLDRLYARLDALRTATADRLAAVRRSRAGGNAQNRSERDALATTFGSTLVRLSSVESKLCFGRLDLRDGERRYVGRIGLADDDQRQLLLDWRAPAAEPFYRATAAEPGDVVRRRHLATRDRSVLAVEDEVLDLDHATGDGLVLNGEGALMAALTAQRTGRMGDIVATIQAEQDEVVRSPLAGVLVVQGGPGTGKTAVALHRAAYLLYTYRDRLRSGVLVVGPTPVFLRYIEAVLPSLGETGVVMATPGRLLPGVDAVGVDAPRAAALKGDLRMAGVVREAVRARQRVPGGPRRLEVDGTRIVLEPADVERARSAARRTRRPHNGAREVFVREVLLGLAERLAEARHRAFDPEAAEDLLADLRDSPSVRREVNLCWMPLTPSRLVADLWADPGRLAAAAPYLSRADQEALRRDRHAPMTPGDVPLLDEAAELIGEDDAADRAERARAAAERAEEVRYAGEALRSMGGTAAAMVSADVLASRFADEGPTRTVAERAAGDRSWAYAHVVVDEAQELSPMTWRLLFRRCPTRSMTVVGDPAQATSAGAAGSWRSALDRHAAGRWRVAELTVSYRTPAEVMALAASVLEAAGSPVRPPRAARSGEPPAAVPVDVLDAASVADVVRGLLDEAPGKIGVIVRRGGAAALARGMAAELGHVATLGSGPDALDADVAVLDVAGVKGLEFDHVVLCEPAAVVAASPRGVHDLYVALTRCTRRLLVVHAEPLPPGMEALERAPATSASAV